MKTHSSRWIALIVIASAAGARPASAAEIALYEFAGGSAASTDTELNSTAADFVKNPATSDWGFSGSGNVFARSSATTASEADALTAGDYFSFTVTPDAAYEFDLTELAFDTTHNATFGSGTADTGATMEFFVRSSADGFTSNVGSTFSQAWNTTTSRSVDLTGAGFQNLQIGTEFRFYIYDSGVDTDINGARIDNVSLGGAVLLDGTTGFQEGVAPTGAYTHDAVTIRSAFATTNQNTSDQVIVGVTAGNETLRGLLEFDISTIAASDDIDSASLTMTVDSGLDDIGADSADFNLYTYGFDINEAVSDWNDPDGNGVDGTGDTTAGGTLGTLLSSVTFDPTDAGLEVTFADSAAFRAAVENALAGDGILRLILAKASEATSSAHEFTRFFAESDDTAANRPRLLINHSASTVIPAPAALPAGLALIGLIAARRRRA